MREVLQTVRRRVSFDRSTVSVCQEMTDGFGDDAATQRLLHSDPGTQLSEWAGRGLRAGRELIGGQLLLTTMREGYDIDVDVEVHPGEPPALDDRWSDVVDVPFPAMGPAFVADLFGSLAEPEEPLPLEAGVTYRLRYAVRDADAADPERDEQQETYLLQFWPAPLTPAVVCRAESNRGQYWLHAWEERPK
ncbi:hypothetical protein [Curtobacterium sp. MCBD17_040]|uniref:hypothetical protein n=1 Tax=Curtobacterium sp. MCBD17_040 TaxID=2175674 RepID=UPI000DA8AEAC|nr:hypothetical protein [Curtobacterium sp. MCBD17_040]WIB65549.1 hypothetical protein DEI94_19435 [Curtobacterium sp. MCBD17_040]